MFVKKTIVTALSLSLAFAANADEASDLKEMKEILAKQQAQIETLNKQIKEQETANKEAVAQYVKTEVDNAMKSQKSLLGLGKHISALKFSGDLRLRYQRENDFSEDGSKAVAAGQHSRDRFRQRLRIGMEWTSKDENWTVGTRLASGSADGRSTNDTYGDESGMQAYEHGDIRIDLAFARMNLSQKEDDFYSALTMGQQKNPYLSSFIFTDGDLNPIGVTYQYNVFTGGNADMKVEERQSWFNTFGVYTVDHRNSGRETNDIVVVQGQTGYRGDLGVIALGYAHYNDGIRDTNLDGDKVDSADIKDPDYGYNIVDAYGELKAWEDGANSIKLLGHVGYNLSASGDSTQTGVSEAAGMKFGEGLAYYGAIEGKFGDFKASYGWAHVEADSLPQFMLDSDFAHGASNYQGHVFKLAYNISKNLEIGGTALLAKTIEENTSQIGERDLYQLDLVWKF
ncbi:MAG: hypothetical protein RL095_2996 [Verrucomicrobiota bacterium]|jgi:hypothetical protein